MAWSTGVHRAPQRGVATFAECLSMGQRRSQNTLAWGRHVAMLPIVEQRSSQSAPWRGVETGGAIRMLTLFFFFFTMACTL